MMLGLVELQNNKEKDVSYVYSIRRYLLCSICSFIKKGGIYHEKMKTYYVVCVNIEDEFKDYAKCAVLAFYREEKEKSNE